MVQNYILGIFLAIFAGIVASSGNILQKNAVNKIPKEQRDEKFIRTLLKSPSWLFGSILSYGVSSGLIIFAQVFIGPALIPGLFASGLIVLAIGSIKLLNESLKFIEILGILIIVAGITFLGFSELDIPVSEIKALDLMLIVRVAIFSGILMIFWIFTTFMAKKDIKNKGLALAFSGGYLFILGNLWTFALILTISAMIGGTSQILDIFVFIIVVFILIFSNLIAIKQTQEAYKYAQASIVQPSQEVPKQIAPVFIYFLVFLKTAPIISLAFIILGSILVIMAGFLLGKRQADVGAID